MVCSMTGFGSGTCEINGREFTVEIKSVNHRYCDIFVKMPMFLNCFDDQIKKNIGKKVFRGKLDVFVSYKDKTECSDVVEVNHSLATAYYNAIMSIAEKNSLREEVSASYISRLPEVMKISNEVGDAEELSKPLMAALDEAVNGLVAMRQKEGEALKSDILLKKDNIFKMIDVVEKRSPLVVAEHKERLENRINDLLNGKTIVDENRIATEVAFFADKSAIDEEITRLKSHVSQLDSILNMDCPVGRKLDFLIQEMNREVNTIGSKSNDIEITNAVLDMKSEIEKIREQVQNIE